LYYYHYTIWLDSILISVKLLNMPNITTVIKLVSSLSSAPGAVWTEAITARMKDEL